jgi:hypothetical protein
MHSITTLLPLFALTACVLAAPTPLRPVAREVPNLHEVIRNPAPINSKLDLNLDLLGLIKSGLEIHARTAPAHEAEAMPPVVVDRTVPVAENM